MERDDLAALCHLINVKELWAYGLELTIVDTDEAPLLKLGERVTDPKASVDDELYDQALNLLNTRAYTR